MTARRVRTVWRIAGSGRAALLALSLLAGCGGPSPTALDVSATAGAGLNPNSENQPSPTVVRLYDLKSLDAFNSATFNDLFYADTATLGGDMLGRKELQMLPGKTVTFTRDAAAGTQYVGVVAGYRSLQGNGWRATMPVRVGDTNPILITLGASTITIGKKPSSGFLGLF
ncbi:MAG: type VI secretion system lipoprotein TssJ [Proteobacteria bacterium]|nr:type VI secretion system lipoprotein TssJ [Pseudomonadota bacterium]